MSRHLRVSSVLVMYDGPEVVLGEDAFGTFYVGLFVKHGPELDTYLVSAVTPHRLDDLLIGQEDLRPVFTEPEDGLLYTIGWSELLEDTQVELQTIIEPPEEWFPDPGFLVSVFLPEVPEEDAAIQAEAVAHNRAVVHLNLGHHTAVARPRIDAEDLSGALHAFQQLVKQAFRRSVRGVDRKMKDLFADPDHHELQVYAFSPGSFRVHLQVKALPNLFGGAALEGALEKIDAMTAAIHSPEESLEAVRQNRGHLASAYSSFLEFVKEADEPVSYSWTTPGGDVIRRSVTPDQATVVLEVLKREKELGSEWQDLIGVFTQVNTNTGSWTLADEAGRESHGSLHEDADDLLSGVVVKESTYKLTCEEILAETVGSGRHKTKLLLRHLDRQ